MQLPKQVKPLLMFFAIVFSLTTAIAQYFYVKRVTISTAFNMLENDSKDLNSSITFDSDGIINLEEYEKAMADVSEYYVVLKDGTILDTKLVDTKNISNDLRINEINAFLPPVSCPVLRPDSFDKPYDAMYQSQFASKETWRILAKKLKGGTIILGISGFEYAKNPDELLENNLKKFKLTLEDAKKIRISDTDTIVCWALIDDAGRLINGYGRIPLKTDAMQVGKAAYKGRDEKNINGIPYIALYAPVRDDSRMHREVGTMILPKEIGLVNKGIDNLEKFGIGVSTLSLVLFIFATAFQATKHEQEKMKIRETFQNYFSPQILEAILKEPELLKLGGQRREVTILFSDIRSFTSLSEGSPPQQITRMLQEYFTEMTEAVHATDGVVDKYIGDAIMAFWGAPIEQMDQADRAVKTAINMINRLDKLKKKWADEGLPIFDIGIGINLGVATVGNFGSSKRFDYTLIGDAVNVASRLESLNKKFNSRIIISKSTKDQLTTPISVKDLGEAPVKGRDEPIRVFEVI